MGFLELHWNYLLVHLLALLVASILSLFFTRNLWASLAIFLVFVVNNFFALYYQVKLEGKTAITVMKGK